MTDQLVATSQELVSFEGGGLFQQHHGPFARGNCVDIDKGEV